MSEVALLQPLFSNISFVRKCMFGFESLIWHLMKFDCVNWLREYCEYCSTTFLSFLFLFGLCEELRCCRSGCSTINGQTVCVNSTNTAAIYWNSNIRSILFQNQIIMYHTLLHLIWHYEYGYLQAFGQLHIIHITTILFCQNVYSNANSMTVSMCLCLYRYVCRSK